MTIATMNCAELVQAFTDAFTSDDVESFFNLIAPGGEWVIMSAGETFRGLDQIKQLAMRSVAARTHGGGLGIKPTNIFINGRGGEALLGIRAYGHCHRQLASVIVSATRSGHILTGEIREESSSG
jgi:hypothetical protein